MTWDEWAAVLASKWNRRDDLRPQMQGAGPVALEVIGDGHRERVVLCWDDEGVVEVQSDTTAAVAFAADAEEWRRFFAGEYSAVIGVMSGKIKFEGPMSFAIKYGRKFDVVRDVAGTVGW